MMIRCLRLPPATLKQSFRHGTCEYNRLSSLLRLQHSQFFLNILHAKIRTILQSIRSSPLGMRQKFHTDDVKSVRNLSAKRLQPARREKKDGCIHRLCVRLYLASIADTWHLTPTTPIEIRHLRHKITIKTVVSMSSVVYLPLVSHACSFENVQGNSQFRSACLVTSSKWLDLGKISQFLATFKKPQKIIATFRKSSVVFEVSCNSFLLVRSIRIF